MLGAMFAEHTVMNITILHVYITKMSNEGDTYL